MSVDLLGAVTPIHMVGESHSLVFSNLLFRPEWSQETYLCRTRFFPTLESSQYSQGNQLSADYINGLIAEGIVDPSLQPAYMHITASSAFLAGVPVMSPPMVLFAGDMDLYKLIQQFLAYDFMLPDDPGYGVDKAKQILPVADVQRHILSFLSPFFFTVEQLKAVGFSRMMIHCLPPRTTNDDLASRWAGKVMVPASVRAKLALAANRLIEEFCIKAGIGYIDTWPELTENGYLKPEFELDGAHVNRDAALVSLDRISACLFDRTADVCNDARYKKAHPQADYRPPSQEFPDYEQKWRQAGLADARIATDMVDKLRGGLSFDIADGNPYARPDWIGRPRHGHPGIVLAEPNEEMLADATSALGEGEMRALLHAGSGRELTVASFRPVRYSADAHDIDPLPSPPETRRALIFLSETDRITFEALDGQSIPTDVIATGSVIVYDPHRVRPRLAAGLVDFDVIEMTLMPRLSGQPFRIVSAGLCDFPADPYVFSVSGMNASPAFEGSIFNERARWNT